MNALSFLNSPLLWGMALAAVPIIIHLLYRRRFRRVDWAPMYYLKLSIQRNRRRVRLEQLLLLALRTLAVLLVFLVVARPVMNAQGLGGWLAGRSRTSQVLVIDNSLSMGYREAGRSAFERAQELADEILRTIGPKDRFTLVLSSQPGAPLLREVEVSDRATVRRLVQEMTLSDSFTAWGATLATVEELVASATYPIREVTLVTDLRRAGFDEKVAEVGNRWAGRRVKLRIFDVGSQRTQNLALLDLVPTDRVALAGTPTRWQAVAHNATNREIEAADATFAVDGKPGVVRLPTIAAGATVRVPLKATFQDTGTHWVSLELPADDLPGDNQRWSVMPVRESLHFVLVDGEPSTEPLGGEADFLSLALSLGVGDADAWQVEIVTDAEWTPNAAAAPDLLVLANVARLTPQQAKELSRMVERGMGLMIFAGDQVDPDNYNQHLYKDGTGLLPAPLEAVVDREVTGLVLDDAAPSPLEVLRELNPATLERIRTRKYLTVQPVPEAAANKADGTAAVTTVVARWNNPEASPAVLYKQIGRGRVLLWTVTADKAWSDWPTEPSYVLAVREAAKAIVRAEAGLHDLSAGDVLRRPLPASAETASAAVEPPGDRGPQPAQVEEPPAGTPADQATAGVLSFADTRKAGLYKVTWRESQRAEQQDLFAVNPDRRESELARLPPGEVRSLFGTLEPEVISATTGADTPLALRGQEIWRPLATLLLGLLAVETCFAYWAGRPR